MGFIFRFFFCCSAEITNGKNVSAVGNENILIFLEVCPKNNGLTGWDGILNRTDSKESEG